MKLAIVGSRSLNNYETVKNAVNSLCGTTEVTEVVSGGARVLIVLPNAMPANTASQR